MSNSDLLQAHIFVKYYKNVAIIKLLQKFNI